MSLRVNSVTERDDYCNLLDVCLTRNGLDTGFLSLMFDRQFLIIDIFYMYIYRDREMGRYICMYMHIYIYIYIYVYACVYVYIYTYIFIYAQEYIHVPI